MKTFLLGACAACALFACAAAAQPVVFPNGIVNAASFSPVPMPNSGVARGSMFAIYGQNMGPASSPALAWPLKAEEGLGGVVVKIQPSSGPAQYAIMLYVSPGQINAILPSATPEGQATLTVTYNGATSAPQAFTVVKSSVGLLAWNQQGNGPGVVQNYHGSSPVFNSIAESAMPGDVAVLWGTGLGPVTFDEKNPPIQGDLGANAEVWVAGQRATVQYAGRSTSAGQDQINFVVPNVEACYVPVFVKAGNVVSNTVSMSISRSGKTCSDPFTASDVPAEVLQRDGLRQGAITLSRVATRILGFDMRTDSAGAVFYRYDWARLMQSRGQIGVTTPGACNVATYRGASAPTTDPVLPDPLDAGAPITITGPDNVSKQMTSTVKGTYSVQLGGGLPGMPGSLPDYFVPGKYTVTGPGGADVGAFTASITLPAPMTWTNADAINEITRSSGVTVTWSGGAGYVAIFGYSGVSVPQDAGAQFACFAPAAAGTFTVPAEVLLALPPSSIQDAVPNGALIVGNYLDPVAFTAAGLNSGTLSALFTTVKLAGYK
jgi:uncharacterized protein (TIGR03437 family)